MKKFLILILPLLFIYSCSENSEQSSKQFDKKINVAVFNGNGASPICVLETMEALKLDDEISPYEISAADIVSGALDTFEVLFFPGGSGSKELNNLGTKGAEVVKNFVRQDGKGIVGICAGGYLLSTTPTYPSLQLLSVSNYDRKHYARGRGLIQVEMTDEGLELFPELEGQKVFLQYYDGPVLVAKDSSNITYTELAKYLTDIHPNPGIPSGVTPGKTFMVEEKVGNGKIIAIGGHPEATQGYRWMVPRMARLVSDGKIKKYNDKWYRFELYKSELLFTPELKKKEKQLFWNLLDSSADAKIAAIDTLYYKMHSRPSVRWALGLLRDSDPRVRAEAAKVLRDAEYTYALAEVKKAYEQETDKNTKEEIRKTVEFLSNL